MKVPAVLLSAVGAVTATTIAEINGDKFISPLKDENVTDVEGLVLAKGPNGVWLRSTEPDDDDLTSEAIYLFNKNIVSSLTVGEIIRLDGTVLEYQNNKDHIPLTEIADPQNVEVLSANNTVTAIVIGEDTDGPPTEQWSGLDDGDIFAVPNAATRVTEENPTIEPTKYGLDFWQSLNGELVTIKSPVGVTRPNQYGDTWVLGPWKATGRNEHGGITMTDKDANPETIVIGSPLDGSKNPETKMGDKFAEITGVVTYAFGFYRILPLKAIEVVEEASDEVEPTTIESSGDCRGLTFGSYNVENMWAESEHIPDVAKEIIEYMKTPDFIFLQEVQDNNGPDVNDDVVSANLTLQNLVDEIESQSSVEYAWVEVEPVRNQDGGQPGGNIRNAYIYRPDVIELYNPNQGGSTDEAVVLNGTALSYNPGRIDIDNDVWSNSRKPLVAAWRAINGPRNKPFYTINVHNGSKGGSSTLGGNPRPPVNNGVDKRAGQVDSIGSFIEDLYEQDPKARIIAAGDFNEFAFVEPQKRMTQKYNMTELDELLLPEEERYSYVFDGNAQQLDHLYVSPSLIADDNEVEHIHLASWKKYEDITSDHDPIVAYINVCGC